MPALITLDGLSYSTPDGRPLLQDLTLSFGRERTGVVGRNGVGKTTLARLILGKLEPTAGTIARAARIGVLRQVPDLSDVSIAGLLGVAEPLARLARITAGAGDEADLAEADWTLEARIEEALADVGLSGLDLDRPAASLSGGEATRAGLARLLLEQPDLLLLDEPTNNLDAASREAVGQVLERWRGGAVVISHDRSLLRRMDRILELTSLGARLYGGGFDLYAERKAEEEAAAARQLAEAGREAARVDREAQAARERQARRDSAGRRFAASGSAPQIALGAMKRRAEESAGKGDRLAERQRAATAEALEAAEARVERVRRLAFDLPPTGLPAGRTVLELDEVGFAWPGAAPILAGMSLRLTGPERAAITGPNGAGKTTLLKLVSGEFTPTAGRVSRTDRFAMLDQRAAILDPDESVLANFRRLNPGESDNACRAALARFLFRAEAALQRVGSLSGGERLRAALACVLGGSRPAQLLVLDEPTNHLDLDSIAAIEAALAGYDGALLVVSHDPDFLEAVGARRRVELGLSNA